MPASVSIGARPRRSSSRVRVQVSVMQRSRLLSAAVATVAELGWSGATVAHITARARVSRRTFYDLFDNREDCLLAVLEDVVGEVERELVAADLGGLSWRERVRGGLWTILCFLDREPALARVCVAQALHGGPRVLARREEILGRLAAILDEGRRENARGCPPLTAEGLVGATFAIVYARLTRAERKPLTSLLPELMGMIVLPYQGPAAARREQRGTRTFSSGRKKPAGLQSPTRLAVSPAKDPLEGIPMRLTYRTARVLEDVAAHPGVSNRVVGELAGISDQGQVSKLLARLERLGLLQNTGGGRYVKGEPNAWALTPTGRRVAQSIRVYAHDHEEEVSEEEVSGDR
jgi:AcrR family transcriptional regulator/DNA-binding MarR family transcriptional regulator